MLKFTLKVKANPLKLYRDLDQIVLHLWSIFENVVCEMAPILSRPQYVNMD